MLLAFAREGLRDAEIAVRLSIPISSVKARFDALERRAHLRGRQALAAWDPATEEAEVVSPLPAPQPTPASPRSRSGIVMAFLGLAAITAVIAFFATGPQGEELAPRTPAAPSRPPAKSAPLEIELLQNALAYRRDPAENSIRFGAPVPIDPTFAVIVRARDGDGRPSGLDRIYVPPGKQDSVLEPLFRVPPGWELTATGGSFGGARLAVIYARDGEANLAESYDGGMTWEPAVNVPPGTQVAFVSASRLVLAEPGGTRWWSPGEAGASTLINQPGGTTGGPVGIGPAGVLLWKAPGARLTDADGRTHISLTHTDFEVERLNAYAALSVNGLALVLWSNPDGVFTSLAAEDGSLITTFFSTPWSPVGPAATLRVVGNHCPAAYPETEVPGLPCQAVLFHPGTGTLHPIVDPLLQTDQIDPTPIVASQAGPFALVHRGGGCLPIHAGPSTSSATEGCATPGQLLTLAYPGDLDGAGPIDPHFVREDARTWVHIYDVRGIARWVDAAAIALGFVPPFP
jgi:hypothetical protein